MLLLLLSSEPKQGERHAAFQPHIVFEDGAASVMDLTLVLSEHCTSLLTLTVHTDCFIFMTFKAHIQALNTLL